MSLIHDAIGFSVIIKSGTGAPTTSYDVVDEYTLQHISSYFGGRLLKMMHHQRVEDESR
jgi:hypothetical protein